MLPVPPPNLAPSTRTLAPSPLSLPSQKRPPPRSKEPTAKRPTRIPRPTQAHIPDDIGKYVARDVKEVEQLGWAEFVRRRRGRGDFASLEDVGHPARRLLRQYKHRGAPVVLASGCWTEGERQAALKRGPHRSATEHAVFLREEFSSMIEKGQWVILPYSVAKGLPGLRLSPPGVKVERDRRPRWLGDYSFF